MRYITGSVWGVIDFVPETDFPDQRALVYIQSEHASALNIPREGDLIRLYMQHDESTSNSFFDPETGRIDMKRTCPQKLLAAAQEILKPYTISAKDGRIDWWTLYAGK